MYSRLSVGRKKRPFGVADSANVRLVEVHSSPVWSAQESRYAGPIIDPRQRLNSGSVGAHWTLVEQSSERKYLSSLRFAFAHHPVGARQYLFLLARRFGGTTNGDAGK